MQNVAIVTRGGKRNGEDAQIMDPIKLIRLASPKPLFRLKRQKQYFKEAVETFAQLGGSKGNELPQAREGNENQVSTSTTIEEWFRLFLKIVTNAPMLEQLKQNMEMVVQETTGPGESNDTTHQYIRRVKINKRRIGK